MAREARAEVRALTEPQAAPGELPADVLRRSTPRRGLVRRARAWIVRRQINRAIPDPVAVIGAVVVAGVVLGVVVGLALGYLAGTTRPDDGGEA